MARFEVRDGDERRGRVRVEYVLVGLQVVGLGLARIVGVVLEVLVLVLVELVVVVVVAVVLVVLVVQVVVVLVVVVLVVLRVGFGVVVVLVEGDLVSMGEAVVDERRLFVQLVQVGVDFVVLRLVQVFGVTVVVNLLVELLDLVFVDVHFAPDAVQFVAVAVVAVAREFVIILFVTKLVELFVGGVDGAHFEVVISVSIRGSGFFGLFV